MMADKSSTGSEDPRGDPRFQIRIALIGAAGAVVAATVGAIIGLKPWTHLGAPRQSSSSVSPPVSGVTPSSASASSPPAIPVSAMSPSQQTYYFYFTGSSQYSCSNEGIIHSVVKGPKKQFYFLNNSTTDLRIIWLNNNGNRETEETLPSGATYSGDFYIGDAWLIASPKGTCQGIFVVRSIGGVTIQESV
jgi:hypothetical protein